MSLPLHPTLRGENKVEGDKADYRGIRVESQSPDGELARLVVYHRLVETTQRDATAAGGTRTEVRLDANRELENRLIELGVERKTVLPTLPAFVEQQAANARQ